MSSDIQLRELKDNSEYAACVALQRETWGPDFRETVPPAILKVAQKIGGVTAGAFDNGELIGFVFGMTGVEAGTAVHWSDMLAVRSAYQNRGIGERLKQFQRELVLARGVQRMYWTFDPLDAKNAHLNFARLGIIAREYVVDMYGDTSSPLHANGTDRLIAIWDLANPGPRRFRIDAKIEIPADIHELTRVQPDAARQWCARTRADFMRYLPDYIVTGFQRGGNGGYYGLTSASNFAT